MLDIAIAILNSLTYIHIQYFAWEDQSKKSALYIIKLQVCFMKNKAG